MSLPFDPDHFRDGLAGDGCCFVHVDVDGNPLHLRFTSPEAQGHDLAEVDAAPPPNAELAPSIERIRQRLKRHLDCKAGPPVAIIQAIALCFGYRGSIPTATAEGLRLLLQLPGVEQIDWGTVLCVVDENGEPLRKAQLPNAPAHSPSPSPSPGAPTDRVSALETTVASLSATLQELKINLGKEVAQAIRATLAANRATTSDDMDCSAEPSAAPPVWTFKSESPAMQVLGKVYSHLLTTGASDLAAELYGIRGAVDYAFLPAMEAGADDTDNVYVSKSSKKRWKTDYPPPERCYDCRGMHWRADCTASKTAPALSFPRGQPPGRYYTSKNGKTFDTTRRPPKECDKCGKGHWFWSCPKRGDLISVPRGAQFSNDKPDKIENSTASRLRPVAEEQTTETGSSYSEPEEQLPKKRKQRKHVESPHAASQHYTQAQLQFPASGGCLPNYSSPPLPQFHPWGPYGYGFPYPSPAVPYLPQTQQLSPLANARGHEPSSQGTTQQPPTTSASADSAAANPNAPNHYQPQHYPHPPQQHQPYGWAGPDGHATVTSASASY